MSEDGWRVWIRGKDSVPPTPYFYFREHDEDTRVLHKIRLHSRYFGEAISRRKS